MTAGGSVGTNAASFPSGFSTKEVALATGLGAQSFDALVRVPPTRYVRPGPLSDLRALSEGDDVSVIGTVSHASLRQMSNRRGRILSVRLRDDSGESMPLTFFIFRDHLAKWHMSRLTDGARVLVSGTVSEYRGAPQITHPDYVLLPEHPSPEDRSQIDRALLPSPVYPLRGNASQKAMRTLFDKAVESARDLADPIPEAIRNERGLPRVADAVRLLHAPQSDKDISRALAYFRFEEAFLIQSVFARRRAQDAADHAPGLSVRGSLSEGLDERIPFELSESQVAVGETIAEKIGASHPTSLLLQGDVGSGKTIVALRAMVRAVDSGCQAALLAPTEVLARQHFATVSQLLGPLARAGHLDADPSATKVKLLVGAQSVGERRSTLSDLVSGDAGIVIGTHALLTESVEFFRLGLVVIDEQHRFGVDHRRQLRGKGNAGERPHTMVMTATPIPRTAALSLAGDLDTLVLAGREGGEATVESFVVPLRDQAWASRMWERTREEIRRGRQAFVVCPRIDGADTAGPSASFPPANGGEPGALDPRIEGSQEGLRSVEDTVAELRGQPEFAGVRIEPLHSRLSSEQKQATMEEFARGDIDILVATTVIEVGVDVPNAGVMIVLDAERFGLAQLHQLRGRIGRGAHPGIAFFATASARESEQFRHLSDLAATSDGFALAEIDLARRGSGDLIGDVQSGSGIAVRFLDLSRDVAVVADAREDALFVEASRRGTLAIEGGPTEAEYEHLDAAMRRRVDNDDLPVERS